MFITAGRLNDTDLTGDLYSRGRRPHTDSTTRGGGTERELHTGSLTIQWNSVQGLLRNTEGLPTASLPSLHPTPRVVCFKWSHTRTLFFPLSFRKLIFKCRFSSQISGNIYCSSVSFGLLLIGHSINKRNFENMQTEKIFFLVRRNFFLFYFPHLSKNCFLFIWLEIII